jgi:uncharacterized membrane protein
MASKKGSGQRNRMNKKKSKEELERIEKADREKRFLMAMFGIFIVIVLIALAFRFSGPENTSDYSNPYTVEGSELLIPLSDVSTSVKYYSYETKGEDVKFFVVEGSDGQVHTAFDACEVCWQEEKGYAQNGDKMQCRNCGNQYSTNQIGTANQGGGCWPGYMQRTVSDGYVRIKLSELDRGRSLFP